MLGLKDSSNFIHSYPNIDYYHCLQFMRSGMFLSKSWKYFLEIIKHLALGVDFIPFSSLAPGFWKLQIIDIEAFIGLEIFDIDEEKLIDIEGFMLMIIHADDRWSKKDKKHNQTIAYRWINKLFEELKKPRDIDFWNRILEDLYQNFNFHINPFFL